MQTEGHDKLRNNAKMFRGSVSGFNKEDVNKYIIEMNTEFSAKEEEYKAEIESLKSKLAISAEKLNEAVTALDSVSELEARCRCAEDELEHEKKLRGVADEMLAVESERTMVLEAELEGAKARIASLENELAARPITVEAPDKEEEIKLIDENGESDCDKVKLYDELRGNIGDILLKANKNADDIVKEAERKAAVIENTSRERAEAAKRRLTVVTGRTVASLKKNAIHNADSCVREFRSYSEDISATTRAMNASLEKKYLTLTAKMEALGNELEEGIKSTLRDFDKSCSGIKSTVLVDNDK